MVSSAASTDTSAAAASVANSNEDISSMFSFVISFSSASFTMESSNIPLSNSDIVLTSTFSVVESVKISFQDKVENPDVGDDSESGLEDITLAERKKKTKET